MAEKQKCQETYYRVIEVDEYGDGNDQVNLGTLSAARLAAKTSVEKGWAAVVIEKVHRVWKDYGWKMEEETETIEVYGDPAALNAGGWKE